MYPNLQRFLVLNWYWSSSTANSSGIMRVTRQDTMSCNGVIPCNRDGQSTVNCSRAPVFTLASSEAISKPRLLMFTVRPSPISDGPPERVRYRTPKCNGNRDLDLRSKAALDSGCMAVYHSSHTAVRP